MRQKTQVNQCHLFVIKLTEKRAYREGQSSAEESSLTNRHGWGYPAHAIIPVLKVFCVVQGKIMTRNTVISRRRCQNHTASTVASALTASKKPSLGQRRRTYSYPWLQQNPGIKLQASQSAHCEHQTPLAFAINTHGCGVIVTRSLPHGVLDRKR